MNRKKLKLLSISYLLILLVLLIGQMTFEKTLHAQNTSTELNESIPAVMLISIDGLKPDYVANAVELNLDIPHLSSLWETGVYATGVKGVLPTSTYPSHTTIITGVSPDKHGVISNSPFDPYSEYPGRWFWYSEELLVPTLWEIASDNGYQVGSISWPVTVGMHSIHYNIPEFMPTRSAEDVIMTRALATPAGLMYDLEGQAGEYLTDHTDPTPRDWSRVRYTKEIIKNKKPNFLTVHLTSLDGLQHANGPYTQEAFDGIEKVDEMVGILIELFRANYPHAVVSIVSDHGFAETKYGVRLISAFVDEGLIELETEGDNLEQAGVKEWIAMPYGGGGSSAIILKDSEDEDGRNRVRQLLKELKSDPENGIVSILEKDGIQNLGGASTADFWVDFKSGFRTIGSLNGPLVTSLNTRGTHGHSPQNKEMDSTFIIEGKGVKEGIDLGRIDMRSIAPTIAEILKVSLTSAELGPLDIFEDAN